jgi:hypothetical protein
MNINSEICIYIQDIRWQIFEEISKIYNANGTIFCVLHIFYPLQRKCPESIMKLNLLKKVLICEVPSFFLITRESVQQYRFVIILLKLRVP